MASVSFQAITAAAFATLAGTPANLTAGRIYFVTDATSGITRMVRCFNNGTSNVVENVLKDAVATPIGFDGVSLSWKNALSEDKTLDIAGALKVGAGTGDITLRYGDPLEYIIGAPQKDDTIAKALARLYNYFDVLGEQIGGKAAYSHGHSSATTSAAGFMSSADKTKLNGIATGANAYTHPSDGGGSIATDLANAVVVSKIVVNAAGHVTSTATRQLTLENLGYTGDTNANYYTHPTGDGNLHVPANGTSNNGKFLKASGTAGSYSWSGVTASDVGLGNVTNESKATMFDSAALTGTPTAPTASSATNNTQIATTAFVQTVVGNAISSVFKYMGSATAAAINSNNTAIAGHAYRISAAGNITGAEGDTYAEIGDLVICTASTPSRTWTIVQNNINLDGLIYEAADDYINVEFNAAQSRYTIGHTDPGFTGLATATGQTLSFGGTFTALIDTGFSHAKGHLTGLQKKTFTLPSQTNLSGLSANSDASKVMTSLTHSGHALTATYSTIISRLLTGYAKGAAATAIAATDTLGAALGKLECRLDVVDTLLTWQ